MTHALETVPAHYGDCIIGALDGLARPGRWTAEAAIDSLLQVLIHPEAEDGASREVVKWARRDVPELRSAKDQAGPDSLYRSVAKDGVGECIFLSGRDGAEAMGYGPELGGVSEWQVERFVGLGCPWRLGLPSRGERILDLGSGAGVDQAIASNAVGPSGRVVGLDRLPYLAAASHRPSHARTVLATATACPLRDGWASQVIANGLPPLLGAQSAPSVLREVRRILRPHGMFRFTTLVVGPDQAPGGLESLAIVDAIRCSKPMCFQYRSLLAQAGFDDIDIQDAPSPFVPGYRQGPVHAVLISARSR